MNNAAERPDPDALLQAVNAVEKQRGKLKIFFGGCAGVGKTYHMLEAAHKKRREGVDAVIGVVETHGRPETQALLEDIPLIPLQDIPYRGMTIKEFALDGALQRKPQLLLLDELAHTNAPGTRHPKRWQDIEELLDAGIDVYTTLNVQHLESLNDIVAAITGIAVKETVPDAVFDNADDIELVDISPDELLQRLQEGKVYIREDVQARASENFFKKSNLNALRELALRRTAERVDAQMGDLRLLEGVRDNTPVTDKVMVCVGPDPLSARLVRSAKRLARGLKAPWTAVYVENNRHHRLNARGKHAVQLVMQLSERLGAKTAILHGDDPVAEIMSYARSHGITKIVIGKPNKARWRDLLFGSLADKIIHASGNAIDVYVVTGRSHRIGDLMDRRLQPSLNLRHYLLAIAGVVASTGLGLLFGNILRPIDQVMIYLAGGVLIAARIGFGPSLVYALLSVNTFNFFFIEPRRSFNFYDQSYWMTFAVMLMTNFVVTSQASRLRQQALIARQREHDTRTFYDLTRDLAMLRDYHSMAKTAIAHIETHFQAVISVWGPTASGRLESIMGPLPGFDDVKEMGALQWCYDHSEQAGHGTSTMPSAAGLYFPLLANNRPQGVLCCAPNPMRQVFSTAEIESLEVIASLLATAFARVAAAEATAAAEVETEREKMRNVLLSSVSHDLRTPLASIIGSSSTIVMEAERLPQTTVIELARSINQEANRLSRMVTNLIDVTKLEAGSLKLNLQPYYLEELLGAVLARLQPVLAQHRLATHIAAGLPMLLVDGQMVEQVLTNILENAAKYTPPGSIITITARRTRWDVLVTISDNGPGVPGGFERKIFDKFYALDREMAHKGTGLGLAICAGIIKAHNGEIWEEASPEGGASFHFTLPVVDSSSERGDDERH